MNGFKLLMIFIVLLAYAGLVYGFYQDEGNDPTPEIEEMVEQRRVMKEKYAEYKEQKELQNEMVRERMLIAEAKLKEMQESQQVKNGMISLSGECVELDGGQGQKQKFVADSRKTLFFVLILAMISCVYKIYVLSKNKS